MYKVYTYKVYISFFYTLIQSRLSKALTFVRVQSNNFFFFFFSSFQNHKIKRGIQIFARDTAREYKHHDSHAELHHNIVSLQVYIIYRQICNILQYFFIYLKRQCVARLFMTGVCHCSCKTSKLSVRIDRERLCPNVKTKEKKEKKLRGTISVTDISRDCLEQRLVFLTLSAAECSKIPQSHPQNAHGRGEELYVMKSSPVCRARLYRVCFAAEG